VEASALRAPTVGIGRLALQHPLLRLRSDDQLIALFRFGSDEAFRVIHDRYRPRIQAYARQMLAGSQQDAEDATQDVFVRAYRALRADERPIALRAWLYRVARNRCIDEIRRPVPDPNDVASVQRHVAPDPELIAERREDLARLVADLRRLPDQQRSVLLMRELEGLSYADLAAAHNVTIPAIKSLLVRARTGLAEQAEARDADCGEIRHDLALAHGRGVRTTALARRHLRDCAGCQGFRQEMRRVDRSLKALTPTPLIALLAKLGIGGSGGGAGGGAAAAGSGATFAGATGSVAAVTTSGLAAAGSGAAASSGLLGGGLAALGAAKAAAVVAATVVVGAGGAVTVEREIESQVASSPSGPAHVASATSVSATKGATAAAAPATTALAPLVDVKTIVTMPAPVAIADATTPATSDTTAGATVGKDDSSASGTTSSSTSTSSTASGGTAAPDDPLGNPDTTAPATGSSSSTGPAVPISSGAGDPAVPASPSSHGETRVTPAVGASAGSAPPLAPTTP
jgi:RNA polymerase sigma factor (sigma-70 family)